jgi:hypothetical protein
MRSTLLILTVATLTTVAPMALAEGAVPNPVVNPGFEAALDNAATDAVEGTPADECVGVGHQVFYGDETVQSDLADDQDPQAAADRVSEDPAGQALFTAGYGHCVYSDEKGTDVAWLNPVETAGDEAVQWSGHGDDRVGDLDEDGDREIGIAADGDHHNLWQAWPSPFQAFTANFEALEFDVEAGALDDDASVKVSLSTNPLEAQTDRVLLFLDCDLTFTGEALEATTDDGRVSMSPTDAIFRSRSDNCDDAEATWEGANEEERAELLGRLRVVQLSFWGFEDAPEDPDCGCAAQIDDVALSHATSVAEEAANGNVNLG